VVIGIDDYGPHAPDLTAATADARLVTRALGRVGFGRSVVLLDGEATRDRVLGALAWLAEGVERGDVGVLFYAGHVRKMAGDPDGDGEEVDEALLAADGRPVTDGEVASALAPARGALWLVWAACYAAGFSDAAGPGRFSTYASGEEELAYESRELGHSFLAEYAFRRALLGAGRTTVEGIHRHVSNSMRGGYERFRPIPDDRVRGRLVLPDRSPREREEAPEGGSCLVVLRCRQGG
jgi:hypothetical protein